MRGIQLVTLVVFLVGCGEVQKKDQVDATVDPCANATCSCTAATEDTDCGAHEYCNVAGPGRTCDCVAGYTGGINGCVWTGTILDPGLASQTTWTPAAGALLNPTAVGGVDPGEASFVVSALCGLGNVKQTFDMPTLAKSEQLVLELSYKNQVSSSMFGFDSVLMGIGFNGNWVPMRNYTDAVFHTERVCLGEMGYAPSGTVGKGAPVTLQLGPYMKANLCPNSMVTNFAIDHAQIVTPTAGECGTGPGLGPNFDAEGTTGWTFTTGGTSTAGFVAGIGAGGTKAARINQTTRCDVSPSMAHNISVINTANPALDMFVGTGGAAVFATGAVAQGLLGVPLPNGTTGTVHACLPLSLRGQSTSLTFNVRNGAGGLCTDVVNDQVLADNVKVVDDPACGSTAAAPNAGFEQPGAVLGGTAGGILNGGLVGSAVLIRAGAAHSGTHFLSIESYGRCSSAALTLLPTVPIPSGANGPALTFFSNLGANPDATTTVRATGSATSLTLVKNGGWLKNTVCLDPSYAGRPLTVRIDHYGGSGLCDGSGGYGTQAAQIDDIDVTTDPACPAM